MLSKQSQQLSLKLSNSVRREFYNILSLSSLSRKPYQFVLIMGHMRAGSSLLTQILASNPEILGYGETHLGYYEQKDIRSVIGKVYRIKNRVLSPGDERYILDKVLHDYLVSAENVDMLNIVKHQMIFLIRSPIETISSVMRLLKYSEIEAANYYNTRLNSLKIIAKKYPNNTNAFITYDQLLLNTQQILSILTKFMDLEHPLLENYEVEDDIAYGNDPSDVLKSGFIVRKKNSEEMPILSRETISMSMDVYRKCYEYLSTHCISLEKN